MALATMSATDLQPKWSDIFSDSEDEEPQTSVQTSKQAQVPLANRFVDALMDAARHSSEQLRLPPVIEFKASSSRDATGDLEDDDISEEQWSDSEEEADAHPTSKITPADAMRLFYKPVGDWAATASQPIENARIIKTLHAGAMSEAFIKQGIIAGREITYISKTWKLNQEWEGFTSEMALYSRADYLRPLQGIVIPKIIGVYLVESRISIAMELPHSSFWVEATDDMSDELKCKCISAFDKIHERGVLHGDAELRHMLIGAEGGVTIIDFQMSKALRPIKEVDLEGCTPDDIRVEKRKVLYKLDYGDSREYENLKRKRVIEKAKRNASRRKRRFESSAPVSDSEDDDKDDVLNPIVPSGTWMDEWLSPGSDFEPSCVVVPGQPKAALEASLKAFADSDANIKKTEDAARVTIQDESSVAPTISSNSASDNARKRKRSEVGMDSTVVPAFKKVARNVPVSPDMPQLQVPIPSDFCNPPFVAFDELIGMDIDEIIVPLQERDRLHIPFENWDGKGGGVVPNGIADDGVGKHLGDRRRRWIIDANAARCRRLGLPYPAKKSMEASGALRESPSRIKKKPLISMGGIKRDLEDKKDLWLAYAEMDWKKVKYFHRRRQARSGAGRNVVKDEGENDSDDDHPELPSGPRIVASADGEGNRSTRSVRHGRVPLRSALRRPLVLEERLRQSAYESTILALRYPDSSEDEDPSPSSKLFSIRRDLKREKHPPGLAGHEFVSTSTCKTNTAALAMLEAHSHSTSPVSTITNDPTVIPRDLCSPERLRRAPCLRPTRRSHGYSPHAAAAIRLPLLGDASPLPREENAGHGTNNPDLLAMSNAQTPIAVAGAFANSIAHMSRSRRMSLPGRRSSLVTRSYPSPPYPSSRPRSHSSPNVLHSFTVQRCTDIATAQSKSKAVDPTGTSSGTVDKSSPASQSRSVHLKDAPKSWL